MFYVAQMNMSDLLALANSSVGVEGVGVEGVGVEGVGGFSE
ncbi:hypothetical protein [Helicobacter pylori]|nr:hypothetical protein [Helicobacter pylori]